MRGKQGRVLLLCFLNETLTPECWQNFSCSAIGVIDQLTINTLRTQDLKYLHRFRKKVGTVQHNQGEQHKTQ